MRPARAAKLKETGLRIVSPHGDATLRPTCLTPGNAHQTRRRDILVVKALSARRRDGGRRAGGRTRDDDPPVLNDMAHMERLAKRFSPHAVVGGVLKVSTTLDDDGRIVQLSPLQELAYGELDCALTPRIRALRRLPASRADRRTAVERDQPRDVGEMDPARRARRDHLPDAWVDRRSEACPGGAAFALKLIDEVLAIVSAVGVAPSSGFAAAAKAMLSERGSPLTSSMFRDLQRGGPIEGEAIVGDLLRRGAKVGINAPLLSAAYVHLAVHQKRIGMGR